MLRICPMIVAACMSGQNAPPPGTSTATTAARPPRHYHRDRHRHQHPAGGPQARPDPPRPHDPGPPRPPTRQERITAIITSQPPRDWSGHELASLLGVKPRNMLTQLGQWARLGFFTRTGFGTYRLNTPSSDTPSTNPPDP
jgi:hypothetical protein